MAATYACPQCDYRSEIRQIYCQRCENLVAAKIEVPVLDATAIGVSVFRSDFTTAGSIMFLLEIGELLEEWTHKKSVEDLARSMSLQTTKVWMMMEDGADVQVSTSEIKVGDKIRVQMGNVIPL